MARRKADKVAVEVSPEQKREETPLTPAGISDLYLAIYRRISMTFPYLEFCVYKDSAGSVYTEHDILRMIVERCTHVTTTSSLIDRLAPVIRNTCTFQEAEIKYALGSRNADTGEIDISKLLRYKILQSINHTLDAKGENGAKNMIQASAMKFFLDQNALKGIEQIKAIEELQMESDDIFTALTDSTHDSTQ